MVIVITAMHTVLYTGWANALIFPTFFLLETFFYKYRICMAFLYFTMIVINKRSLKMSLLSIFPLVGCDGLGAAFNTRFLQQLEVNFVPLEPGHNVISSQSGTIISQMTIL